MLFVLHVFSLFALQHLDSLSVDHRGTQNPFPVAEFAPYLVKLYLHGHLSLGLVVGASQHVVSRHVGDSSTAPFVERRYTSDWFLPSMAVAEFAARDFPRVELNLRGHLIHRVIFEVLEDLASPGNLEMAGIYTAYLAA